MIRLDNLTEEASTNEMNYFPWVCDHITFYLTLLAF